MLRSSLSLCLRLVCLTCAGLLTMVPGASAPAEEVYLVDAARSWRPGEPIPALLLSFQPLSGCLSLPPDTYASYSTVDNPDLLFAVILSPEADERVVGAAVEQALLCLGPTRFFQSLLAKYNEHPELLEQKRHKLLAKRARLPHALIDGLFITDDDMSLEEREAVLSQVRSDLAKGGQWDDVYLWYSNRFEYTDPSSGMHLTKIGNEGDLVINPDKRDGLPLRATDVPRAEAKQLLRMAVGDVLVFRRGTETILYRVRETYP